jgi:hypothetical protein
MKTSIFPKKSTVERTKRKTGANGAKQQQQDNNGPEQKRTCVKKFKQQIQMFKCLKFKLQ